jgi:protease-4
VDHLGGLKDASDAAAKLADLDSDYDVEYLHPDLTFREALLTQMHSSGARLAIKAGLMPTASPLSQVLDPLLTQARKIQRLQDPRGLFAYCWCQEPFGQPIGGSRTGLKALTNPR